MKDHLIKDFEMQSCLYCGKDFSSVNWSSEFEAEHHYKCVTCSCGKKNTIKVDFHGSGHDKFKVDVNKNVNDEFGVFGFDEKVEGEFRKVAKK